MTTRSKIEWTDMTWSPVRGCSRISPGCENCYAERQAYRFSTRPGSPYEGLVELGRQGPRWTGQVRLIEDDLHAPLRWKKHRRVFVNSMSDLFHEALPDDEIDEVFAMMLACEVLENRASHTFQILTKRANRMREYFSAGPDVLLKRWAAAGNGLITMEDEDTSFDEHVQALASRLWSPEGLAMSEHVKWGFPGQLFPLPNVWLGVSVENQEYADKRIPDLLQTPAAVRFVSYEPALGPVNFENYLQPFSYGYGGPTGGEPAGIVNRPALDWIIVGGESGPGARPFDVEWAENVIRQCRVFNVPVFMKQLGANVNWNGQPLVYESRKGNDASEWPYSLQVCEMPKEKQ